MSLVGRQPQFEAPHVERSHKLVKAPRLRSIQKHQVFPFPPGVQLKSRQRPAQNAFRPGSC